MSTMQLVLSNHRLTRKHCPASDVKNMHTKFVELNTFIHLNTNNRKIVNAGKVPNKFEYLSPKFQPDFWWNPQNRDDERWLYLESIHRQYTSIQTTLNFNSASAVVLVVHS